MKKITAKRLASGAAMALALGLSSQVQAGAIAYSYLDVSLALFDNNTGTQLDATDFSFLDIADSASASSVTSFGAPAATASPGTVDTLLACSGGCAGIAENDPLQQPGNTNFGRGDTFGQGATITFGGLPVGGNTADVFTVAEGRQSSSGFTTAQSGARNTTEFDFILAGNRDVRLDMASLSELFVELHQDLVQAQASFSWNVTVVDVTGGNVEIINWSPDGIVNAQAGGTELADTVNINNSRGVVNAGADGTGLLAGTHSFLANTLLAGNRYKFTIGHASQINTEAVKVPEPSILLLLGIGLAGLGLTRRRKLA